jgi:prepilin-type processing-associated H-X9-DG protein
MKSRSNRRGLTMVELVVIVAVVAAWAAMLVPSVMKVRRSSDAVQCAARLKQLGTLTADYAAAHGGRLPGISVDESGNGDTDAIKLLSSVPEAGGLMFCPAVSEVATGIPSSRLLRPGEGDRETAWSGEWAPWVAGRSGTYGWNMSASGLKVAGIKDRGTVPIYADSARPAGRLGIGMAGMERNPLEGLSLDEAQYVLCGGFAVNRHNGGINALFADGHVEAVPLGNLPAMSWWPDEE